MSDYEDDDFFEGPAGLDEEELLLIQQEYRRQKLKENLIGPCASTMVHVSLLVLCAIFFTGEVVEKNETVEITPVQEESPKEEPPPPPPPPEIPPPEPQEVVSHDPQVTSDAVPDAADLVGAIDDVSDEPPSTDDNATADLVSDIKPSASSIVSAKMFGGRSSAGRAGALKSYGGQVAAQQSLQRALKWLAKVQNPDGSWGKVWNNEKKHLDGFTGLALLVFLAHGETPKSSQFGQTVSNAIQFLASSPIHKSKANGYPHAIKTYALAEAYTMTGNYNLEAPLVKFADTIIKGHMPDGGYVYEYKTAQDNSDISFAGWNYQAMKALKSTGLDFDGLPEAIDKSVDHLKKIAPNSFPYRNGKTPPGKAKYNQGLHGVGTLCLQLFGEAHNFKPTEDLLDGMKTNGLKKLDWDNPPHDCMYSWYYQTFALFQKGGSHWKAWNAKFQNLLKSNQNPEGYWKYPGKFHGPGNGKDDLDNHIHGTVFACLMLTVYYRYLPSTSKKSKPVQTAKSPKEKAAEKAKKSGEEEIDIF